MYDKPIVFPGSEGTHFFSKKLKNFSGLCFWRMMGFYLFFAEKENFLPEMVLQFLQSEFWLPEKALHGLQNGISSTKQALHGLQNEIWSTKSHFTQNRKSSRASGWYSYFLSLYRRDALLGKQL